MWKTYLWNFFLTFGWYFILLFFCIFMVPGLKKHHEIKLKLVLESKMSLLSIKIIDFLGIIPFVATPLKERFVVFSP